MLDTGEIDTSLLTLGKAAIVSAHSNQLVGFQAVTKSKLAMAMYPSGEAEIEARPISQAGDDAQHLCEYEITGAGGQGARLLREQYRGLGLPLGVERGVPPSRAVRRAVEPTLDDLGRAMAQYIGSISDKVGALPAAAAAGRR